MTRVPLVPRCRYDDDHYPGTVCHPFASEGDFAVGFMVKLRNFVVAWVGKNVIE